MPEDPSLNELWHDPPTGHEAFSPDHLTRLPVGARRYLMHAIAPETRLASAVRLRMSGEIRLRHWLPFEAEQVIRPERGLVWRATVRMHGLPVTGFDLLIDGTARMRWSLFGLVPLMRAEGPDITRSAMGRLAAESIWIPSFLARASVHWKDGDAATTTARFRVAGNPMEIELKLGDHGELHAIRMRRWGNPGGGIFRSLDFGAHVEDESAFGGYTIPTRLRAGWHVRNDGFAEDGEFFRATIHSAEFR